MDNVKVKVDENDIPGAKFVYKTIDEHTNTQLKRWLKCRGLPTTGKRMNLIERSFPSRPIHKYFNPGHIYHYLVDSISSVEKATDVGSDDDDIHTSKPLRKGRNLFRSGHVKNMQDAKQKDYLFVQSQVQASYSQQTYNSTITMSQNSDMIKERTCTCSASGLGRCAHVAAILYAIEDYVETFERYVQKSSDFVLESDPRPSLNRSDKISQREINPFLQNLQSVKAFEEC
ncbi:hypothetical protein KUTeg_021460 [Tegillarca granosa]|uniref:SWIM-type domain-containing protein n=1 Tax=Tegillarca granosa TaxID=220873 RepID=A0ABQ9E686_TEGGR|nr:hypothetical protein KUTeg_021460 [Tegillarca granosa]